MKERLLMKQRLKKLTTAALAAAVAGFLTIGATSCSSRPRGDIGEVQTLRMLAESQLELGSREADRGNHETAFIFLNESRRLATLADDPGLLVRSSLALGNALLSAGHAAEAFDEWAFAERMAQAMPDAQLAAVSRVHAARGRLTTGTASAQAVLDDVNREIAAITSDQLYLAFSWQVIGLSQRALSRFAEAEASMMRSLAIHERGGNLELAANDWFVIGSIRSLSGNYPGALQALQQAVELDRRTENSWGLANDWRAKGDVHRRAGNPAAAREAYLRSAAIFRAMGREDIAANLEEMAEQV
ncbi:MAG: tetratricopeptide repeat protein [Spirochaetes bacterium]|nr:tetratricopeptide repeat protein [Spirochaetota bacterium]